MVDEVRRPGQQQGIPGSSMGARARNRTVVMSPKRAAALLSGMDDVSHHKDGDAKTEDRSRDPRNVSQSGKPSIADQEYVSPVRPQDEPYLALEEIFGKVGQGQEVPLDKDNGVASPYEEVFEGALHNEESLDVDTTLSSSEHEAYSADGPDLRNDWEDVSEHLSHEKPRIIRSTESKRPRVDDVDRDPYVPIADDSRHNRHDETRGLGRESFVEQEQAPYQVEHEPPPQTQRAREGTGLSRHSRPLASSGVAGSKLQLGRRPVVEEELDRGEAKSVGMPSASIDEVYWHAETPLVGFLVTFDINPQGTYVELHSGRLLVSNQREESGNCLVLHDPSVSSMHAIMKCTNAGAIQILDQLSELGTRIRRAGQSEDVLLSGEKGEVYHGDTLFFGERRFEVVLISGVER